MNTYKLTIIDDRLRENLRQNIEKNKTFKSVLDGINVIANNENDAREEANRQYPLCIAEDLRPEIDISGATQFSKEVDSSAWLNENLVSCERLFSN